MDGACEDGRSANGHAPPWHERQLPGGKAEFTTGFGTRMSTVIFPSRSA